MLDQEEYPVIGKIRSCGLWVANNTNPGGIWHSFHSNEEVEINAITEDPDDKEIIVVLYDGTVGRISKYKKPVFLAYEKKNK